MTMAIKIYYNFGAKLQQRSRSQSSHVSLVDSMHSSRNVWCVAQHHCQLQHPLWSFQCLVLASLDSIHPARHTLCIVSVPTEAHKCSVTSIEDVFMGYIARAKSCSSNSWVDSTCRKQSVKLSIFHLHHKNSDSIS